MTDELTESLQALQLTGLKRNVEDKFYTNKTIVGMCIPLILEHLDIHKSDTIVEPSAGNGSFIEPLKKMSDKCLFYDIKPEHPEIVKQDFLGWKAPAGKIHMIGNPPFGRQSSLAIKFIKKSCIYAHSISFILPKSFKKQSMRNKFDPYFHLKKEIDLPENSFLVNNVKCDVPCVFQIWERRETKREKIKKNEPKNFKFVKKTENPTISFRRVGVNAGTVSRDIENKSAQSHYFIIVGLDKIEELSKCKFAENNTVGPKSISKQELILEFNKIL